MHMAAGHGAKLRVLHVMPPLPSVTSPLTTASRELTERNLLLAVERCRLPNAAVEMKIVESAEAAARILEAADVFDADLIVTGSHGRAGIERVVLGSVVELLLHRCARPMLTIPSLVDRSHLREAATFSRIVCAVDFSQPSQAALAYALSLAEEAHGRLTLLHVIEMPPELRQPPQPSDFDFNVDRVRAEAEATVLNRLRALIPESARDYCSIDTAVLEGGVSRQLLRMAADRQADLIVLGVHGRNAFDLAFFGSNSKDVVRQAHCPVLVVPASRPQAALKPAS
jgi:nucleotide-binding universal stress UspA family protein